MDSSHPSANQISAVRRITWVGLAVNLALSAIKLGGGILGGSRAVVADAVHSLSDGATDLAILIGVRFWSAPPDDNHPHGHGRIETLVTTAIGLTLGGVALGIAWDAIHDLQDPDRQSPGFVALIVTGISIVSKELVYRITLREGRRLRSSALMANAWHHRSDALSSIPAAAAVAVAMVAPQWAYVDLVGALVVAIFILVAAARIVRPALGQLVDRAADPADCDRVAEIVGGTEGVCRVRDLRTRYMGARLAVDLTIHVGADLTVQQGHDIAAAVRSRLLDEGPDVTDVVVHVEPD